ncbi:hypothetical protein Naga_101363g1, partial [Nannochloropsis gaditana]
PSLPPCVAPSTLSMKEAYNSTSSPSAPASTGSTPSSSRMRRPAPAIDWNKQLSCMCRMPECCIGRHDSESRGEVGGGQWKRYGLRFQREIGVTFVSFRIVLAVSFPLSCPFRAGGVVYRARETGEDAA